MSFNLILSFSEVTSDVSEVSEELMKKPVSELVKKPVMPNVNKVFRLLAV